MNHLCGLAELSGEATLLPSLGPLEQEALRELRKRHEEDRPAPGLVPSSLSDSTSSLSSLSSGGGKADDEDGEGAIAAAEHLVASADLPSPSGWRPLDDVTLYRFLCADREGGGTFRVQTSLERLRDALEFRRAEGVDDLLRSMVLGGTGDEDHEEEARSEEDGGEMDGEVDGEVDAELERMGRILLPGRRSVQSSPPSPPVTMESLATGTVGEDGRPVLDQRGTPTKARARGRARGRAKAPPSPASPPSPRAPPAAADLALYRRLRVRVFTGRDHGGRPVLFERMGAFLASGDAVASRFPPEQWCRLYVWDLERHFPEMRDASAATGTPVQRYTYCGDAAGMVGGIVTGNVWRILPLLRALVRTVEAHYPEIVERIVLFNVPRAAAVFYRAVRKFLDPVTAAKISLHAGVPLDVLGGMMSLDAVPAEYGGTSQVPYPAAVTG